jgi:epoxyqueuosine reductase
LDICPTQALLGPQRLDARRCISYLTIELDGPIPEVFRPMIGNRVYGCDDCQWVCPWNKFAQRATLADFDPREGLSHPDLVALLAWSEAEFLRRTEGSAIRRIGHSRWLRNLSVAAGNALRQTNEPSLKAALSAWLDHPVPWVREHMDWALAQPAV